LKHRNHRKVHGDFSITQVESTALADVPQCASNRASISVGDKRMRSFAASSIVLLQATLGHPSMNVQVLPTMLLLLSIRKTHSLHSSFLI